MSNDSWVEWKHTPKHAWNHPAIVEVRQWDKISARKKNAGNSLKCQALLLFARTFIATTEPTVKYSNYTILLEIH